MRKVVIPYALFFLSCNPAARERDVPARSLEVVYWPAFTEHARLVLSGDSLSIVLGRHPYLEREPAPDTFYCRKIKLSDSQCATLDSALIGAVRKAPRKAPGIGRDGIGIYFIEPALTPADTLKLWSPPAGSAGHELAIKSIRLFRNAFQDSVLSPYFDELSEYLDATQEHSDTIMWDALKRRREAVYPKFKYRR